MFEIIKFSSVVILALIMALINYGAIYYSLVYKEWHSIQLGILMISLGVLLLEGVFVVKDVLLTVSLYYATFEVSLNLLRRKPWDYVGSTSQIDKFIIGKVSSKLTASRLFIISKIIFIVLGILIYIIY